MKSALQLGQGVALGGLPAAPNVTATRRRVEGVVSMFVRVCECDPVDPFYVKDFPCFSIPVAASTGVDYDISERSKRREQREDVSKRTFK